VVSRLSQTHAGLHAASLLADYDLAKRKSHEGLGTDGGPCGARTACLTGRKPSILTAFSPEYRRVSKKSQIWHQHPRGANRLRKVGSLWLSVAERTKTVDVGPLIAFGYSKMIAAPSFSLTLRFVPNTYVRLPLLGTGHSVERCGGLKSSREWRRSGQ
jgi:hypothetical protein